MSGLVIDRYNDQFTVQAHTHGIAHLLPAIVEALRDLFPYEFPHRVERAVVCWPPLRENRHLIVSVLCGGA